MKLRGDVVGNGELLGKTGKDGEFHIFQNSPDGIGIG
jgi:hypothetical protein